jgi:glucan phosphoethanolaminetransferase (alkaline phosphatase superfamily)
MNKLTNILIGLAIVVGIGTAVLTVTQPAHAIDVDPCKNTVNTGSALCNDKTDANGVIKIIINTLLFLIGVVAVIVIIIAGIRYTTSGGNANSVSAAKNMLLYAVIGLVVAIFAFAIVNWIVFRATNP